MARPRKDIHVRLTKRLPSPRCTEVEYVAVSNKAIKAGLTLTEYVRRQALNGKVVVRASNQNLNFELIHELRKLGTNVNQIAKNMNIFGHPDSGDINRIKGKLENILDNVLDQM